MNPVKLKKIKLNIKLNQSSAKSKDLKLPRLNVPILSPERLFPLKNKIGMFNIKDIVSIENYILKPFKF